MILAKKIIIVTMSVAIVSLIGTLVYHTQQQNYQRQICFKLEDDIIAGQKHEDPATVAFQASDFNARCADLVGPGNNLVVSSQN